MIPDFFTNPVLRPYLSNVQSWQGYIRFLGLPARRDNPDIVIDRLFVSPLLTRRYVSPDESPENWEGEAAALVDALVENTPLVLLGDPGIGKSTLLNYVAWLLSRLATNALIERLGWRLPLPMVLREMPVRGVKEFDGLLDAFLSREMTAPLRQDDGRYLKQALAEGRAFLLLDGIDELGDRKTRENLRSAVFDGMARYPDCRWLLTSRIVGYDEVPFDTERSQSGEEWLSKERNEEIVIAAGETYVTRNEIEDIHETEETREEFFERSIRESNRARRESAAGQVTTRYIAPFDDRRIAAFARNWYVRREASASRASANANHLVQAVHADESSLRLARVPNLLTMMALIHRIEATLPHGRALLYERITEAYLESIDKFRGIESSPHDLPRKKGWLARVGFEMQRRRMEQGQPDGANILMGVATVREWLNEEMGRSDAVPDTPSAEEFLKVVGRRSGLFLPRGEGRYAFVHLSFQEYFAAFALKREVTRLRWAKGTKSRLGFDRDILADWAGQSVWRETFTFLLELLASEEEDDWHADLLDCLFGENFSRLNEADAPKERTLNLGLLLARLLTNSRAGLASGTRELAIARCVTTQLRIHSRKHGSNIFRVLLGEDVQLNEDVFEEIKAQMVPLLHLTLDLSGARIADVSPLAAFSDLPFLNLAKTQVSDLSPIKGLTALRSLDLTGTPVSDLSPLSNLRGLISLNLGYTHVTDLSPIEDLATLRSLDLRALACDLAPLMNLSALQSLDIVDAQVTNFEAILTLDNLQSLVLGAMHPSELALLASLPGLRSLVFMTEDNLGIEPLSKIPALEELFLVGTQVSDFAPLAGLATLKSFNSLGAPISDISPLANLPVLESLHLNAPSLSNLSPLAEVVTLRSLYLATEAVVDLTPLVGLPALHEINLSARAVDLTPLRMLASLRKLVLGEKRISSEHVEYLRLSRPDVQIIARVEDAGSGRC